MVRDAGHVGEIISMASCGWARAPFPQLAEATTWEPERDEVVACVGRTVTRP